jgi:hypothetical protein
LANQLIFGEAYRDTVESRPTLTSLIIKRVAVVTLLYLKNECAPPLQSRPALQVF